MGRGTAPVAGCQEGLETFTRSTKRFQSMPSSSRAFRTPRQMEAEWINLLKHDQGLPQYRIVKFYKGEDLSAKLLIRDGKE